MIEDRVRALWSVVRIGQFASVGAIGAVIDVTTLAAVVEFTGIGPLVGKLIAAETAILVMFVINEHWTFADFGRSSAGDLVRRFVKSNTVRIGGTATAFLTLYLLHSVVGIWYLAANVAGIGLGFFVNYAFESLFTWRVGG